LPRAELGIHGLESWPGKSPEKSEKRGVHAARDAPSEDRKCWQLIGLGIHSLKSRGRNSSRKSPGNAEFKRPETVRARRPPLPGAR